MRQRGRRSAEALSVIIDARQTRLDPPATLSESESQLFREIVASHEPRHFARSDLPLLCRYVEGHVLAERAAAELRERGPVIDGRVSPWLAVHEKAIRALMGLSMRLRLSPQSRIGARTAERNIGPTCPPPWKG